MTALDGTNGFASTNKKVLAGIHMNFILYFNDLNRIELKIYVE